MAKGDPGSTLAELRARTVLQAAGLEPTVFLERATSVTNEVWLTPTHVVRLNRSHDSRLSRESMLARALPRKVGYPRIVASGAAHGEDWLVVERVPGSPLAHQWPEMAVAERREAVRQIASRMAALHATPVPAGLLPIAGVPQLLDPGTDDPTRPLVAALEQAARLDHVDPLLLREAEEMVVDAADALRPMSASTLVHGDLHFENVLWHRDTVTAVLDFEWARAGPADLDLDIMLRCCAYPQLHVGEAFEAVTNASDYAEVPAWLLEDYPALFTFPRLADRMRLYSLAYDVRDLLSLPPAVPVDQLSPLHAYHRLERVVQRTSYLDELL